MVFAGAEKQEISHSVIQIINTIVAIVLVVLVICIIIVEISATSVSYTHLGVGGTWNRASEYVCPYDFNHTWAQICDKRGEKFIFDGNWGSGEQYYETIFPKYCGCKFHGKYGRPFRYG